MIVLEIFETRNRSQPLPQLAGECEYVRPVVRLSPVCLTLKDICSVTRITVGLGFKQIEGRRKIPRSAYIVLRLFT